MPKPSLKKSSGTDWRDKEVHTFPKGISPKVTVIAWPEFKLICYDGMVQHISYCAAGTLQLFIACRISMNFQKRFHFWSRELLIFFLNSPKKSKDNTKRKFWNLIIHQRSVHTGNWLIFLNGILTPTGLFNVKGRFHCIFFNCTFSSPNCSHVRTIVWLHHLEFYETPWKS